MTKSQILRAANKRYPKKALRLEENTKAPTAAQRASNADLRQKYKAELDAIDASLKSFSASTQSGRDLLAAARFVVDVDGDDPSIPGLATAVIQLEEYFRLTDRRCELKNLLRQIPHGYTKRYTLGDIESFSGLGAMFVLHTADTLAELLQQIESDPTKPPITETLHK